VNEQPRLSVEEVALFLVERRQVGQLKYFPERQPRSESETRHASFDGQSVFEDVVMQA